MACAVGGVGGQRAPARAQPQSGWAEAGAHRSVGSLELEVAQRAVLHAHTRAHGGAHSHRLPVHTLGAAAEGQMEAAPCAHVGQRQGAAGVHAAACSYASSRGRCAASTDTLPQVAQPASALLAWLVGTDALLYRLHAIANSPTPRHMQTGPPSPWPVGVDALLHSLEVLQQVLGLEGGLQAGAGGSQHRAAGWVAAQGSKLSRRVTCNGVQRLFSTGTRSGVVRRARTLHPPSPSAAQRSTAQHSTASPLCPNTPGTWRPGGPPTLPKPMCTLPALSARYSTLPPLKSFTACGRRGQKTPEEEVRTDKWNAQAADRRPQPPSSALAAATSVATLAGASRSVKHHHLQQQGQRRQRRQRQQQQQQVRHSPQRRRWPRCLPWGWA